MATDTLPVAKALQDVLSESLELHLDGITDHVTRAAALRDACGRINNLMATADLPVAEDKLATHRVLIAAALRAAADQLSNEFADA